MPSRLLPAPRRPHHLVRPQLGGARHQPQVGEPRSHPRQVRHGLDPRHQPTLRV